MSGSIRLHPTLGVNPRVMKCEKCGKDYGVAMLGMSNIVWSCNSCGSKTLAGGAEPVSQPCQKCGGRSYKRERTLGDHEMLVSGFCDDCIKEQDEHRSIVQAGGLYFRCSDCHAGGVIKDSEFTREVRSKMNKPAPELFGIEFSKKDCPACGPKPAES